MALVWALAGTGLMGTATAKPLDPKRVAGDARWMAHLDVDRLLQSKLGAHVVGTWLEPKLTKPIAKMNQDLGLDVDWRKVRSLTAYGWQVPAPGTEPSGVVLIESDLDVPALLDAVLDRFSAQAATGELPLTKTDGPEGVIYSVREDVYGAGVAGGVFVLTKTRADLMRALKVVSGGALNLAATDGIRRGPDSSGAILEMGVADGVLAGFKLPKQVKVLEQLGGAWVSAGEQEGKITARVGVEARTVELAGQVRQIVQGIVAFGSLGVIEKPEILALAQSARVEGRDRHVSLAMSLPAETVIASLPTAGDGQGAAGKAKRKRKPPTP